MSVGVFTPVDVPASSPSRLIEVKLRIIALCVNWCGAPPDAETNQRFCEPRSSATKTRARFSSDQKMLEGERSKFSVSARLFVPSEFIRYRCETLYVLSFSS